MSIFRVSDYTGKKATTYSPKTRLPTQERTRKHKCSQCERTDAKLLSLGHDKRWLCIVCIKRHNARAEKETPNFVRASDL